MQEELSRNRSQGTSPGKEGLDLERERDTWRKERKDLLRDLSKFKEKYEKMKDVNQRRKKRVLGDLTDVEQLRDQFAQSLSDF